MSKQKWKNAASKLLSVLIPEHTLGNLANDLVDSVRVGIAYNTKGKKTELYLEEIFQGKNTVNGKVYQASVIYLESLQLFYNKDLHVLQDKNNQFATTVGSIGKGIKNTQAFLLTKNGEFYCALHSGKYDNVNHTFFTHAAFLKGLPAEMTGMISIINGKIVSLSNLSGHYTPDELDMYRAIKIIEKRMPGVISPSCIIEIWGEEHIIYKTYLKDFINYMEQCVSTDTKTDKQILRHQLLRIEKLKKNHDYSIALKEAVSIKVVSNHPNLADILVNLSSDERILLAKGLKAKMAILVVKKSESEGNIQTFSIEEIVKCILNAKRTDAMECLLNNSVAAREDFLSMEPLKTAMDNEDQATSYALLKKIKHNLSYQDKEITLIWAFEKKNSYIINLFRDEHELKGILLSLGAQHGYNDLVESLLPDTTNVHQSDKIRALHRSAEAGQEKIVISLLNNINNNISSEDAIETITSALEENHFHLALRIFKKLNNNINLESKEFLLQKSIVVSSTSLARELLKGMPPESVLKIFRENINNNKIVKFILNNLEDTNKEALNSIKHTYSFFTTELIKHNNVKKYCFVM